MWFLRVPVVERECNAAHQKEPQLLPELVNTIGLSWPYLQRMRIGKHLLMVCDSFFRIFSCTGQKFLLTLHLQRCGICCVGRSKSIALFLFLFILHQFFDLALLIEVFAPYFYRAYIACIMPAQKCSFLNIK